MIKIATFNVQKSGAAKVNWIADMVWDNEMEIDVLAAQELDLHENSAPNFIERLRVRKVHVFLGGCMHGMYRCAVLSKLLSVRLDLHSDRFAGVVFQLLIEGQVCSFTIASYYGCASASTSASKGVEHAVQELKKSQLAWCLVGDTSKRPKNRCAVPLALLTCGIYRSNRRDFSLRRGPLADVSILALAVDNNFLLRQPSEGLSRTMLR